MGLHGIFLVRLNPTDRHISGHLKRSHQRMDPRIFKPQQRRKVLSGWAEQHHCLFPHKTGLAQPAIQPLKCPQIQLNRQRYDSSNHIADHQRLQLCSLALYFRSMGLCLKFQHDQLLPDQKTYHSSGHRQASVFWTVKPTQVRSLQKQGYHRHDRFQMSLCHPGQTKIGLPDFKLELFCHD